MRRIVQLEQRWSRFLPESDVSRLKRNAGQPIVVSPDTVLLIERSLAAWRLTGGAFDPTVLAAILHAGYDRTFEALADPRRTATPGQRAVVSRHRPGRLLLGCTDIEVDGPCVTLPAGTGFDPGGIGKGLAADLVSTEALGSGAAGVCVNLGGDVRVAGAGPDGGAWTVGVEHPWTEGPVVVLGMTAGAVATSTTLRRTWQHEGADRHHLIDPFTGEPSASDVTLASVVSGEAWHAEVLAKAVLLRGSRRAFDLVDDRVIQALTVDRSGVVRATAGLSAFLGQARVPARLDMPARDMPALEEQRR
jgi:thiamine biosynthesis lipoprotein